MEVKGRVPIIKVPAFRYEVPKIESTDALTPETTVIALVYEYRQTVELIQGKEIIHIYEFAGVECSRKG